MRTILAATLLILATTGCGPKNSEVTDEQIDTGGRSEALDSVANTEQDGVRTAAGDTTDNPVLEP